VQVSLDVINAPVHPVIIFLNRFFPCHAVLFLR
jgi:hypothetical protein